MPLARPVDVSGTDPSGLLEPFFDSDADDGLPIGPAPTPPRAAPAATGSGPAVGAQPPAAAPSAAAPIDAAPPAPAAEEVAAPQASPASVPRRRRFSSRWRNDPFVFRRLAGAAVVLVIAAACLAVALRVLG